MKIAINNEYKNNMKQGCLIIYSMGDSLGYDLMCYSKKENEYCAVDLINNEIKTSRDSLKEIIGSYSSIVNIIHPDNLGISLNK